MIPNSLVIEKLMIQNDTFLYRSYNSLFNSANMTTNTENTGYDSDDFM